MSVRRARVLAACAFLTTASSAAANADDCRLQRIASFDFTDNGTVAMPVSIEGTTLPMAIDTGAEVSAVDPVVAGNLHLIERPIRQGAMYNAKGEQFTYVAVLHSLGIGEMHANDVKLLVWPSRMSRDGRIAGVLGADLLRQFDVDIDFGAHKLTLFSQDHCPGKVVYWPAGNVAVVPMHVVNSGHNVLPAILDGHEIDALLDTGTTFSLLSMESARNIFGLTPNSPDMTKTGEIGAVQTAVYRHTFKSLGLEGLAIANPTFYIWDNLMKYSMTQAPHTGSRLSSANESGGVTDLTLGLRELCHLHVYIAYKEQKLYITPASTPAAVSIGGTAAAPTTAVAAH